MPSFRSSSCKDYYYTCHTLNCPQVKTKINDNFLFWDHKHRLLHTLIPENCKRRVRKTFGNHAYKNEGKVCPRTGHEKKPQRGSRCIALLFLKPRCRMGVGGERYTPAALRPVKGPCAHCTGGWVGPRAGLDGCRKSCPHHNLILGPSSP